MIELQNGLPHASDCPLLVVNDWTTHDWIGALRRSLHRLSLAVAVGGLVVVVLLGFREDLLKGLCPNSPLKS